MKYTVELNPAMHLEYFEIEADSPEEALQQAKITAADYHLPHELSFSHWETINVSALEEA